MDIARQSEVGVTVFFVISGFLITYLLLAEEAKTGAISLKAFYLRRAFRILPVYILYVAFILIWRNFEVFGLTSNNLAHVFTFTVNFDRNKDWFLGHFWSLAVEEQFYLFWPAMLLLFRRHLKVALIVLIAYSCIARVLAYKFPGLGTAALAPFFSYSDAIFIGAFGGILFFESPQILKHRLFSSYAVQAFAICVFLLFVYCTEHGKMGIIALPLGNTLISLSVLFLIIAYIFPSKKLMYKLLNNKAIIHIGILSYSIYVWQEFFFIGQLNGFWRTFPYNIVVIYLVSLASYNLWERPFLKLKKRFEVRRLQPDI